MLGRQEALPALEALEADLAESPIGGECVLSPERFSFLFFGRRQRRIPRLTRRGRPSERGVQHTRFVGVGPGDDGEGSRNSRGSGAHAGSPLATATNHVADFRLQDRSVAYRRPVEAADDRREALGQLGGLDEKAVPTLVLPQEPGDVSGREPVVQMRLGGDDHAPQTHGATRSDCRHGPMRFTSTAVAMRFTSTAVNVPDRLTQRSVVSAALNTCSKSVPRGPPRRANISRSCRTVHRPPSPQDPYLRATLGSWKMASSGSPCPSLSSRGAEESDRRTMAHPTGNGGRFRAAKHPQPRGGSPTEDLQRITMVYRDLARFTPCSGGLLGLYGPPNRSCKSQSLRTEHLET